YFGLLTGCPQGYIPQKPGYSSPDFRLPIISRPLRCSGRGEGIGILKAWGTIRCLVLALATSVTALLAYGQSSAEAEEEAQLKVIEVREPDGQILSYRHLAGSTEVRMKGTRLAPKAKLHLKVGSRPGFVELDINRGAISGLKPAHLLGKDFLTY